MPDQHVDLVNKTGFPLQIALAQVVRANENSGWRVMHEEHSWQNAREGSGGYADLVLENVVRDVVLILECKRIQEASYVFLHQSGKGQEMARLRALRLQRTPNSSVEQATRAGRTKRCCRYRRKQRSALSAGRFAVACSKKSHRS